MSINKQLLHEKCLSCVSLNLLRDLDKNYFIILLLPNFSGNNSAGLGNVLVKNVSPPLCKVK